MFNSKQDEIEGLKLIISKQFKQITLLERDIKHLKILNSVKYESFEQKANESIEEKIIYAKKLFNDISEKEKLNNFINDFMKKNEIQCPVCYETLYLENVYIPKCHTNHITCLNCHKCLKKCPLCKQEYDNN